MWCQKKGIYYLNNIVCLDTETSHNDTCGWIYQWACLNEDELFYGRKPSEFIDLLSEFKNKYHLDDKHIRFIVDDCQKFVDREARRGNKYDAIIMDPPSYGRGPNGEVWKFERSLSTLLASTLKILSDKPLFILINAYATDVSSMVLYNMLKIAVASKYGGEVSAGEVGLPIAKNGLILPCGMFGRWESHD